MGVTWPIMVLTRTLSVSKIRRALVLGKHLQANDVMVAILTPLLLVLVSKISAGTIPVESL